MGRRLKIRVLDKDSDESWSTVGFRFWRFGKDVFRYCRDTKLASVTLSEVDASVDSLEMRAIKARDLRTVTKFVAALLKEHGFEQFELTAEVDD